MARELTPEEVLELQELSYEQYMDQLHDEATGKYENPEEDFYEDYLYDMGELE